MRLKMFFCGFSNVWDWDIIVWYGFFSELTKFVTRDNDGNTVVYTLTRHFFLLTKYNKNDDTQYRYTS